MEALAGNRVVPVVSLPDAAAAAPLADALAAGGIRCAEITLRTTAGLAAIAAVAGRPGFVVGAGTVTTVEQVDRAVDAGAAFLVSPGLDDAVLDRAAEHRVPFIPGVATPTEVQRALARGLTHLKLFPAGLLGGVWMVRALAGPFPDVRLLPSGGVSPDTAVALLAEPTVFAVSGSWMVPGDAIARGDWAHVERLSAETIAAFL